MLGLRIGVAVCSFHVVFYDHHVAWASLKLFWLHAPGARPRRHDAAFVVFVVVAVVVRSTLMRTLLWWLSWIGPKKRISVHLQEGIIKRNLTSCPGIVTDL